MADREVHITHDNEGVGLGMVAAVVLAAVAAMFLIFFLLGGLDQKKTTDLTIDTPKVDLPSGDAGKPAQ